MGQIAGRAENHDDAWLGDELGVEAFAEGIVYRQEWTHSPASLTAWPPNSLRRAARTLALNDSSWREWNRSISESVMIGAGTSRLIASWMVQRPSPESST